VRDVRSLGASRRQRLIHASVRSVAQQQASRSRENGPSEFQSINGLEAPFGSALRPDQSRPCTRSCEPPLRADANVLLR
jgi:hypothetical protein